MLQITVVDTETGETETKQLPDNEYVLICTGDCHLAHTNAFANGTHVLTIKGRKGL